MATWIVLIPWILRLVSAISTIFGVIQGFQFSSGEGYGASPLNITVFGSTVLAAIASFVGSFKLGPVAWSGLKRAVDVVFKAVDQALDPENKSQIDEQALVFIREMLLHLLEKLVARMKNKDQAAKLLIGLRYCFATEAGEPPEGLMKAGK